ncbi:hypothetical protein CEXT_13591 [Caerostris extrusa]|uniref:Uncharacterized protein n=1 Tax=Caerostris extrusa TaxID=172846 RepID=A0AAV4Y9X8_CAEEX|nr:hypothetical protein CEXT_13591 [Caerostris extrusa]
MVPWVAEASFHLPSSPLAQLPQHCGWIAFCSQLHQGLKFYLAIQTFTLSPRLRFAFVYILDKTAPSQTTQSSAAGKNLATSTSGGRRLNRSIETESVQANPLNPSARIRPTFLLDRFAEQYCRPRSVLEFPHSFVIYAYTLNEGIKK